MQTFTPWFAAEVQVGYCSKEMPGPGQVPVTGENIDSLGGRYQLITRLGAGGMSEVFLASASGLRSFHKLVVIKRMLSSTSKLRGSERMFMDEAEITARFNHPNIVQTFEIVSEAEHLSIVMEFLEGQSLDRIFDLLETEDVAPSFLADRNVWVRVISDALKGLHYAHELCDYDGKPLNIVHRDISPQNLFLTYDGVVKIVDFGIAKAALSSNKTDVGVIKGKVGYMAPEQAQCAEVDRRTDIFSMGLVLWEFLAGTYMRNDDPMAELQRMVAEDAPPLSSVARGVPSALEAIVAKATARNPDDRYATAQDMRFALEEYLAGQERTLTTADLGHAMTKHFEQDRQFLSQRIREVISGTPSRRAGPRESMELPRSSNVTTIAGTSGIVTGSGTLQKMAKASRRRKVVAAAVVAAVALLAGAALWVVPTNTADTPSATTGAITIESVPRSATVQLDGTLLGQTPLTTRAVVGTHRVTVSKEGFTETSSSVETKSGKTVKLSLALSPIPEPEPPPEPPASPEVESDDKVAPKTVKRPLPSKPKAPAPVRPAQAKPAPKAPPAPAQPNIPIIDESSETKVKVDVIE